MTDTDGVRVWPNVSSWMRDESRSRSFDELLGATSQSKLIYAEHAIPETQSTASKY